MILLLIGIVIIIVVIVIVIVIVVIIVIVIVIRSVGAWRSKAGQMVGDRGMAVDGDVIPWESEANQMME